MLRRVVIKFERYGHRHAVHLDLDLTEKVQQQIAAIVDRGQFFEHELSLFMIRALEPGDTFLDVGANVGFFSILAGALVGPRGSVIAVEPNPANVTSIRENAQLNATPLRVLQVAAASAPGRAKFRQVAEDDSNGVLLRDADPASLAFEVELARLDDVVGTVPKMMKIDVEGAESLALAGASGLLSSPDLHFVACEINDPCLESMGSSQMEVRDTFRAHGFEAFLFDDDGNLPRYVPPGTRVVYQYVANMLFARPAMLSRCYPQVGYAPPVVRLG